MRGRDGQGVWGGHVHTAIFKMDTQQGPTVHGTLLSVMWQPGLGGESGGERIPVYAWLGPFAVDLKLSQYVNRLCPNRK